MRSEPNHQNGASQRVIAASAPGKVILSGEHSVVYNRRAIATTLSLRLTVRLERCQTNTIALISQVSFIKRCPARRHHVDSIEIIKVQHSWHR